MSTPELAVTKDSPVRATALRTGELLIERGDLNQAQLDVTLLQQRALRAAGQVIQLGELLVRNRFVTKAKAAAAISNSRSGGVAVTGAFQLLLPVAVCKRFNVVPLRIEGTTLVVKSAGRLTARQLNAILHSCEMEADQIRVFAADPADIFKTLRRIASQAEPFAEILRSMQKDGFSGIQLKQAVDALLSEALDERASDLHLDVKAHPESFISLRIVGVLHRKHLLEQRTLNAILTRLKADSGMDSSNSMSAQDGRLSMTYQGRIVDFRVASQPIAGGEAMTIRVLDPEAMPSLAALFPSQPGMQDAFENIVSQDGKLGGLVLFSGPTGSGKTTSLYAMVQQFPRETRNINTLEDPVEFMLPFTRQIQLNQMRAEKASDAERALLRQDPDVLVIGEIRDEDSARTAIKFAESGHMVLATVHAATAPQTIERVVSFFKDESGKKEALYVLAHQLLLVVNQRLAPRLCQCAVHGEYAPNEIYTVPNTSRVRKAIGCPSCRNLGYSGRVAAHETLLLPRGDSVRAQIADLLFTNAHGMAAIGSVPGVQHIRREHALSTLIETGLIDVITANRMMGIRA